MLDPYINIWSNSDHLYDSWPTWVTLHFQVLNGLTLTSSSVCGTVKPKVRQYRRWDVKRSSDVNSANRCHSSRWPSISILRSVHRHPQHRPTDLGQGSYLYTFSFYHHIDQDQVFPTTTEYVFYVAEAVQLTVKFITPSIPTDLDILAQPITYLTFSIESLDGAPHQVWYHIRHYLWWRHCTQRNFWENSRWICTMISQLRWSQTPLMSTWLGTEVKFHGNFWSRDDVIRYNRLTTIREDGNTSPSLFQRA